MRVSLYQMGSRKGEPETNLEKAEHAAEGAKRRGSHLLVLPELWATGYDLQNVEGYATDVSEGVFAAMSGLARDHDMAVLGSSPSVRDGDVFNTAVLFGSGGEVLGRYDKIHLFSLMAEDRYLTPGSEVAVFETAWGRVGLILCFDLRFPELVRRIVLEGAQIVFVPAYWPEPRLDAWRTLLRARAIENQVFVVGCNRCGEPGGTRFGYSAVIGPGGDVLVEAGTEEILMTVDIDVGRVEEVRRDYPFFSSRKIGFYGQF